MSIKQKMFPFILIISFYSFFSSYHLTTVTWLHQLNQEDTWINWNAKYTPKHFQLQERINDIASHVAQRIHLNQEDNFQLFYRYL